MSQASKDGAGGSWWGWVGKAHMMRMAQAKVMSSGGGKQVAKCALSPGELAWEELLGQGQRAGRE